MSEMEHKAPDSRGSAGGGAPKMAAWLLSERTASGHVIPAPQDSANAAAEAGNRWAVLTLD